MACKMVNFKILIIGLTVIGVIEAMRNIPEVNPGIDFFRPLAPHLPFRPQIGPFTLKPFTLPTKLPIEPFNLKPFTLLTRPPITNNRGLNVLLGLKFPLKDVDSVKRDFMNFESVRNISVFHNNPDKVRPPFTFVNKDENPSVFGPVAASFGGSTSSLSAFRGSIPREARLSRPQVSRSQNSDREIQAIAENQGWNSIVSLIQQTGSGGDSLRPIAPNGPSSNGESQLEILERNALEEGKTEFKRSQNIVAELLKDGKTISKDEAAFKHQNVFRKTDEISIQMSRVGAIVGKATEKFKDTNRLSDSSTSGLFILGSNKQCNVDFVQQIQRPILDTGRKSQRPNRNKRMAGCNPSDEYRTLDGSCNNLLDVDQGAAFTKFRRVLFPDYFQGVSKLRRDVNGQPLPSARRISTTINSQTNFESPELSIFHMTYGQFIDHDLTSTPINGYGGGRIKCCHPTILNNPLFKRFTECEPIDIPGDDLFYSPHGETCMEFARSAPAASCTFGPREQLNQHSAYLDGSGIYGVKSATLNNNREFTGGKMKQHVTGTGHRLLPKSLNLNDGCNTPENSATNEHCFVAGDARVNEQPWLTFFHTLWIREHNRVAGILAGELSTSDDDLLFEETRRIIVAELQHVTYNEFLPTILPNGLLTMLNMLPKTGNQQTGSYSFILDASIANSFASAAYRFGHSEIGDSLHKVNQAGTATSEELSTKFFHPFDLYQDKGMCDLARGATHFRARKADSYFTKEVAGKLFRGGHPFGLDLVALNIQRGRDHGIPGYIRWLHKCGEPTINTWSELTNVMTTERMEALRSVYTHVRDIDLFAGGISETPVSGGFLGSTFSCLLTDQFLRMKTGDRFWYEEMNQAGSFTPNQMIELHKVSLAKIMCNNIPDLEEVQPNPLKNLGPGNLKIPCSDIQDYNFAPW